MKFPNAPRQPFVGLSLMAAIGIIIAGAFPLPRSVLVVVTIILTACIIIVAYRPGVIATYIIVGSGFFVLHNLETSNTEGQQLADQLGSRPGGHHRHRGASLPSQKLRPAGLRRSS
jgi:hypothetical protein